MNAKLQKLLVMPVAALLIALLSMNSNAQAQEVDPVAVETLQRMTSYVSNLKKFSVHTENTFEDMLKSGQRVDLDMAADVVVNRPNQIVAKRSGELVHQVFYYDGESLTLSQPQDGIYYSAMAPETIEEMIDYAREDLGVVFPISDLVYRNVFAILIEGVNSAKVIGKAMIGGVSCDHLAFNRPDVQFQVWVADGDLPLPCKYVVTDISSPENVSTVSVLSDWNVSPDVTVDMFTFKPPTGSKAVELAELE